MIPILVTGGAGYIGAHTCKLLSQNGFLPIVYDNLSTGHLYAVKWGPLIQDDLANKKSLAAVFEKFSPQAVIHFAADAIVMESMRDPAKYYRNNVINTIQLLETMRDFEVKKLIFSSTCATYGNPLFTPITEEHPQNPINPYGRSKWMVEQIINDFHKAYGLEAIILRYFNAAGADREGEIGENHTPETHLIPSIIEAGLGKRAHIQIYGTDFDSKDGTAVRDYIHVEDLARAHVEALRCKGNEIINLGTGCGYSVLEIVNAVEKYCGMKVEIELKPRREGEPGVLSADFGKAKRLLGWEPKYSDLKTIVASAWNWHV